MSENFLHIIYTFGFSMLPVIELRGAIPMGLLLGLPTWQAFVAGVLGNILIVGILLKFLDPVTTFLMKHSKWFNKILTALFHRTRHKHSRAFNDVGAIFLITFVAIPLPVTGAWTGCLIAHLFGIQFKHAFTLISLGILGAATLITLGFESISFLV